MNAQQLFPGIGSRAGLLLASAAIATVFVVCLGLEWLGDPARMALRFDRSGLEQWQLWRLLTGHFVHLGWSHAAMNLIALALLAALFRGWLGFGDWLAVGTAAIVAIDIGLYWSSPGVAWYVGLSGLLHGIAMAGAATQALRGAPSGIVLALLIVAKLVYEQTLGSLPLTAPGVGGAVIVEAHLYGALGGLIGLTLARGVSRRFGAPL